MLSFSDVANTKVLAIRARNARGARRKLWSEAATSVGDLAIKQELVGSHLTIEELQTAAQNKLDESIRRRWKYTRSNGQKVVIWDVLEKVTRWINKFKEVGDIAVQYDPGHATLPWAAIRFILQASVGSVETFGAMLDGIELTSRVVAVYAEVERTCLRGVSKLKTQLANALVQLYAGVLSFLSKAVQYFGQSSSKRAFKGAFQSYQASVAPYIERINNAEVYVCRLVSLVQSEDQKNLLITTRRAMLDVRESRASAEVPKQEQRRAVHAWLEAVSTAETFQKAESIRHEKTCNWIFARSEYQDWESTSVAVASPKILWIHSGPGFGKTVLCARIIRHLIGNDVRVVYFFCVADEETKRQPYAIIRSWIDQLTHNNDDALDIVYNMYKSIEPRGPTTTELWRIFKTLSKAITCTFVIDGFDECSTINKNPHRHTTDGRSEFLESLIKNIKDTPARVLIVSRDTEDIRAQLGTLTQSNVPLISEYAISANDTRDDIDHCSSEMVNTRLANKSEQLRLDLASEAARKADGMFLWLQLLSGELDPGENSKQLRRIVSEMPLEINETYERDLERVRHLKPAQKARALAILRWIVFALRPLTVRELAEAVTMTSDDTPETYPYDDLPDMWEHGYVDEQYVNSYIRRSCGSLVELRGHGDNKSLAFHTVHFVHFSVKEYLLRSDDISNDQCRLEGICFPDGGKEHNRLAQLCLQYLCYDVFGEKEPFQDRQKIQVYPFLAYAARAWWVHAQHDHPVSEDIMPWAQKLFNPSTSNWILWSKVFEGELEIEDEKLDVATEGSGVDEDIESESHSRSTVSSEDDSTVNSENLLVKSSRSDVEPSPIYYAALLGFTDLVKALQSQGFSCSRPGGTYGFPLQAAVRNAHQETVEYLVTQDIDVNQRGGLYGLAICAAAALGLNKIMDILISAGADRSGEDSMGRNCLHLACKQGARATVKPLLEAGMDPMKKAKTGKTPFYEAVESGDHVVVSWLLHRGADVDDVDEKGIPAIVRAVSLCHEEVVNELIKNHVDIQKAGPGGFASLHEAVFQEHTSIVHILLANSADINAQDSYGWTPLGLAIADSTFEIGQLLIDQGAHTRTSNDDGWTPLHIAASKSKDKVMALLLENGAEVDAETSSSYTSLFIALWAHCLPCVTLLLAHGASISHTNNMGNTILDEAFGAGDREMIQCLLDHGALDNPTGHIYEQDTSVLQTQEPSLAIQLAKFLLQKDEGSASQYIIDHGPAWSQRDLDVALQICCLFNASSMVEPLLARGANIATHTHNKRNLLHFAARNGCLEIIKILNDHGANVLTTDSSGYTPLDLSVARGLPKLEAISFLIESGALANMGKQQNETAVMSDRSTLEGCWQGTYTYNSWNNGIVEPTTLDISFDTSPPTSGFPSWKYDDKDEAGDFAVLGHLLTDDNIRFVKLYKSCGWLYLGVFDPIGMNIQGTWGSSMTVRHGSFHLRKTDLSGNKPTESPP